MLAFLATVKEPPRRNFNADGTSSASIPEPVPVRELRQFLNDNRRLVYSHLIGFLAFGTVISAYLVWVPEFLRRTYDYTVPEAGVIFGLCLLLAGGAGPYFGGWFAEYLSRKGYRDAEMRASMLLGTAMIPLTALAPLAPNRTVAIVMLALAVFSMSSPQGLAPTIIQLFAPNRMRAQVTALFMLVAVLAGFSLGPYFVALLTDAFFGDEAALKYSLAIVSGVLTPIGVASLCYGLKPFGERHAE